MSSITERQGKKWIQTSVALTCIFLGYVIISFFNQMSEWFDLEAKIPRFELASQGAAIILSLGVFLYIMKNPKTSSFLSEVYQEVLKVVWPDKNQTMRHTIGIMIGVTIVGTMLGVFDIAASSALNLLR